MASNGIIFILNFVKIDQLFPLSGYTHMASYKPIILSSRKERIFSTKIGNIYDCKSHYIASFLAVRACVSACARARVWCVCRCAIRVLTECLVESVAD